MYIQEFIFDGLNENKSNELIRAIKTIPGIVSVIDDLIKESTMTIIYKKKIEESLLRKAGDIVGVSYRCPANKKRKF